MQIKNITVDAIIIGQYKGCVEVNIPPIIIPIRDNIVNSGQQNRTSN